MTPNEQTVPEQALKACPFCGGEAQVASYNSCDCCGKAWNGQVICQKCRASRDHFDTDEEAIAAWNTRPAVSAEAAPRYGVCGKCGQPSVANIDGHDVCESHRTALSQPANGGVAREKVLREALETARDYVSDVADGSAIYVFTAKAANEQMRETARKDLTRLDAALAAPGQDEGVGL